MRIVGPHASQLARLLVFMVANGQTVACSRAELEVPMDAREEADSRVAPTDSLDAEAPSLDADRLTNPPLDGAPGDAWVSRSVCELEASNTTISGRTPLGPITLEFGWAGFVEYELGGGRLDFQLAGIPRLLYPSPLHLLPGSSGPALWVQVPAEPGSYTQPATFMQNEVATDETLTATVTIEDISFPNDMRHVGHGDFCACRGDWNYLYDQACRNPPGVRGNLHVEGEGWELDGSFEVPFCHYLHSVIW